MTKTYTVSGMTCGHCVSAVSSEVGKVAGVRSVEVDLSTGNLVVTGDGYDDDTIRAAVDEAGYQLTDA